MAPEGMIEKEHKQDSSLDDAFKDGKTTWCITHEDTDFFLPTRIEGGLSRLKKIGQLAVLKHAPQIQRTIVNMESLRVCHKGLWPEMHFAKKWRIMPPYGRFQCKDLKR